MDGSDAGREGARSPAGTLSPLMPIPDKDIIDVSPTRLNRSENLFIPNIIKGLGTTLRHCFQNIGRNGSNKDTLWVVQYPEEKREDRASRTAACSARTTAACTG